MHQPLTQPDQLAQVGQNACGPDKAQILALGNKVGNEQGIFAVTRPAAVVEQFLGAVDVQATNLDHLAAMLSKPAGEVDPVDAG